MAAGRLQEGWGPGGKGLGRKPVFAEVPVLEMGASRHGPHEVFLLDCNLLVKHRHL